MNLFEMTEDLSRRIVETGVAWMGRLARYLEGGVHEGATMRVPVLGIDLRPDAGRRGLRRFVRRARPDRARSPGPTRRVAPTRVRSRPRIGEMLVSRGLVHAYHIEEALLRQAVNPRRLGQILILMGVVTELDVTQCLGEQVSCSFVDLERLLIDAATAKLVPEHIAQRHQLIPVNKFGSRLTVAMVDPLNVLAIDDIELMTGLRCTPVCATPRGMQVALAEVYGAQNQMSMMFEDIDDQYSQAMDEEELGEGDLDENAGPIIKLVNLLIANAASSGCSEILIEPFERELRVRYRRHGELFIEMTPPRRAHGAILQRLRIMSGGSSLRERHGQIRTRVNNRHVDLSCTFFPTSGGDGARLVLGTGPVESVPIEAMGFPPRDIAHVRSLLRLPAAFFGLVGPCPHTVAGTRDQLVATLGSTGALTVTLGTSPRPLVHGVHHRWTRCGDEISARLDEAIELEPDLLVVDCPADPALLTRLIEQSLAGICVIASLPARDLVEGIEQLQRSGLSGGRIARAAEALIACHPMPRGCGSCAKPGILSPFVLETLGENLVEVTRMGFEEGPHGGFAVTSVPGCDACRGPIGRGGTVAYQVMPVPGPVRDALRQGLEAATIVERAREGGMPDVRRAALAALLLGRTSLEGWQAFVDRSPGD